MSTFLYGANVHANDIRQHYLRYGGTDGERTVRTSCPSWSEEQLRLARVVQDGLGRELA